MSWVRIGAGVEAHYQRPCPQSFKQELVEAEVFTGRKKLPGCDGDVRVHKERIQLYVIYIYVCVYVKSERLKVRDREC